MFRAAAVSILVRCICPHCICLRWPVPCCNARRLPLLCVGIPDSIMCPLSSDAFVASLLNCSCHRPFAMYLPSMYCCAWTSWPCCDACASTSNLCVGLFPHCLIFAPMLLLCCDTLALQSPSPYCFPCVAAVLRPPWLSPSCYGCGLTFLLCVCRHPIVVRLKFWEVLRAGLKDH